MTHLEEKFFNEFNNPTAYGLKGFELEQHYAQIAAKIALDLAQEAYDKGRGDGYYSADRGEQEDTFNQFIQDYLGSQAK